VTREARVEPAEQPTDAPLAELLAAVPFVATLGIEVVSATPDEVVARLAWRAELCTAGGVLNGGALMSLADNTGGMCAFLNLPPGAGTATISSPTNFLRGAREGYVTATCRPLRVGRTVIVVETELRDDDGRLLAHTTQAQAVIGP
jgi:1,4-dihydroxy-2-naphthoyl-CoA hydrolase